MFRPDMKPFDQFRSYRPCPGRSVVPDDDVDALRLLAPHALATASMWLVSESTPRPAHATTECGRTSGSLAKPVMRRTSVMAMHDEIWATFSSRAPS